jgi:hypothetical protein
LYDAVIELFPREASHRAAQPSVLTLHTRFRDPAGWDDPAGGGLMANDRTALCSMPGMMIAQERRQKKNYPIESMPPLFRHLLACAGISSDEEAKRWQMASQRARRSAEAAGGVSGWAVVASIQSHKSNATKRSKAAMEAGAGAAAAAKAAAKAAKAAAAKAAKAAAKAAKAAAAAAAKAAKAAAAPAAKAAKAAERVLKAEDALSIAKAEQVEVRARTDWHSAFLQRKGEAAAAVKTANAEKHAAWAKKL